jgi:hypothetical protein
MPAYKTGEPRPVTVLVLVLVPETLKLLYWFCFA